MPRKARDPRLPDVPWERLGQWPSALDQAENRPDGADQGGQESDR